MGIEQREQRVAAREAPMLWVHATIDDAKDRLISVTMRDGETLEEAMGRGVCYLLDAHPTATFASNVWTETLDEYEVELEPALMDGRISGAIVTQTGEMRKR